MRKPLYEGTPTERESETSNTPVTPEAGQEQRRHQAQLQKHTHTTTRARAAHTSDDQNTPMKCANAPATHVHTTAHEIIRGVPVGGFKLHTPSNHTAGEAIKDMHAGNPTYYPTCAPCVTSHMHTQALVLPRQWVVSMRVYHDVGKAEAREQRVKVAADAHRHMWLVYADVHAYRL